MCDTIRYDTWMTRGGTTRSVSSRSPLRSSALSSSSRARPPDSASGNPACDVSHSTRFTCVRQHGFSSRAVENAFAGKITRRGSAAASASAKYHARETRRKVARAETSGTRARTATAMMRSSAYDLDDDVSSASLSTSSSSSSSSRA
eukprot:8395-Pelagococcus_subviridis.AAC.1